MSDPWRLSGSAEAGLHEGSVRRVTAVGGARICNAMPELQPRQQLVGADRLLLPAKVANGSDVA